MKGRTAIWLLVIAGAFLFMKPIGTIAGDAIVEAIATAIATAEGFYVSGSRPARNHNPGDLTQDITGTGVGWDGPFVVYATDDDGWAALRQQVSLMFGGSHIYNPDMSIMQVALLYTATDQAAWAHTVANALGVTVDTKLSDLLS